MSNRRHVQIIIIKSRKTRVLKTEEKYVHLYSTREPPYNMQQMMLTFLFYTANEIF